MTWLTRLLIPKVNLAIVPILLLGVWLSGVWVGEGRTQRAWDAERHQLELSQARGEQKSADIKLSQEQINHEISNEFNQRSTQLAADWQFPSAFRLRGAPLERDEHLSNVTGNTESVAQASSDFVPSPSGDEVKMNCGILAMDAANSELKREIYTSEQLQGDIGDNIVGDITVISARFNPDYNKHKITARMGESFVDFWFGKELEGELRIKGKIKTQRGNKTTQLNYVKIVG